MPGMSNVSERAEGDPPEPVSEEHQAKLDELRRRLADVERERAGMEHDEQVAPAGWDRIEGGEETDPGPSAPTPRPDPLKGFRDFFGLGSSRNEPIEDDAEELDEPDDADLRRAELENERADIDLGRQRLALDQAKLAHGWAATENELRIVALQTARTLVTADRYAGPVEAAKQLGVIHRAILRMLVEPLPAPKPDAG